MNVPIVIGGFWGKEQTLLCIYATTKSDPLASEQLGIWTLQVGIFPGESGQPRLAPEK
jgi:hypothetical protein